MRRTFNDLARAAKIEDLVTRSIAGQRHRAHAAPLQHHPRRRPAAGHRQGHGPDDRPRRPLQHRKLGAPRSPKNHPPTTPQLGTKWYSNWYPDPREWYPDQLRQPRGRSVTNGAAACAWLARRTNKQWISKPTRPYVEWCWRWDCCRG
jgi:hypothetical protein